MKTKTHIAKLLSAVVAMCASVAGVNVDGYESEQPSLVGFQTVVGLEETARADGGVAYPTDVPFSASAYALPGEYHWDRSKAEAVEYFAGVKVEYNPTAGGWVGNPSQYWSHSYWLTFFAHSPWADNNGNQITNITINTANDATIVTGWDTYDSATKGIDLMIAEVGEGQKDRHQDNTLGGVPTVFRHTLSQVQVIAGLASEYVVGGRTYNITLQRVELRQIFTRGNYSSATSRWDAQSQPKTFVLYDYRNEGTDGIVLDMSANQVGEPTLLLPQAHQEGREGTQAEIFVEWYDSYNRAVESAIINLRQKFTNSYWGRGNYYTYYLTWDKGATSFIEFDKPIISADWISGGDFVIEIE